MTAGMWVVAVIGEHDWWLLVLGVCSLMELQYC